jgi:hypothetical protein
MNTSSDPPLGTPPVIYGQRLDELARPGWFCQGTVVCRPLRRKVRGRWVAKGPYYLWTGKRGGKTVCHALSHAQYVVAKKAIAANRRRMAILARLQALTLHTILKKVPGVAKRK